LIAIHYGRYYKRSDGLALGPGPFVRGLEYASDCRSEVVGKPSAAFFKSALGDIDAACAVMIGDVSPIGYLNRIPGPCMVHLGDY
jgi:ribonucleotide monophosphatase NagD (HAD superfamily)